MTSKVSKDDVERGYQIADLIAKTHANGNPTAMLLAAVRRLVRRHGFDPFCILGIATAIVAGVTAELGVEKSGLLPDADVPPA